MKREISPLEYAREKGLSLTWVYLLLRMGKLPATKVRREWRIAVEEEARCEAR